MAAAKSQASVKPRGLRNSNESLTRTDPQWTNSAHVAPSLNTLGMLKRARESYAWTSGDINGIVLDRTGKVCRGRDLLTRFHRTCNC